MIETVIERQRHREIDRKRQRQIDRTKETETDRQTNRYCKRISGRIQVETY